MRVENKLSYKFLEILTKGPILKIIWITKLPHVTWQVKVHVSDEIQYYYKILNARVVLTRMRFIIEKKNEETYREKSRTQGLLGIKTTKYQLMQIYSIYPFNLVLICN